jgi:hypothetical protein
MDSLHYYLDNGHQSRIIVSIDDKYQDNILVVEDEWLSARERDTAFIVSQDRYLLVHERSHL